VVNQTFDMSTSFIQSRVTDVKMDIVEPCSELRSNVRLYTLSSPGHCSDGA
jgi:hypothetical protein